MRVFRVSLFKGANKVIAKNVAELMPHFEEAVVGEGQIRVEVLEMSEKELAELPEWEGP